MTTVEYRIYFAERREYPTIFRTHCVTVTVQNVFEAGTFGNCSRDLIGLLLR